MKMTKEEFRALILFLQEIAKESTSYYRIYAKEKEKALKDKTITYVEFVKMP